MIRTTNMEPVIIASRYKTAVVQFLSVPASPLPLAVLRVGLATVLLVQALAIAGHLQELYGPRGLVQWSVTEQWGTPGVPRLSWATQALARIGVSPFATTQITFVIYMASLGFLLVGWRTRVAAVVAWLTHLMFNVSGGASVYGVDSLAHIMLFYCVWMPVADAFSVDRISGRTSAEPSAEARLSLRVLQVHMCLVYLASGLEKAVGIQWWDGQAIWRATMRPDLNQFDVSWLVEVPWVMLLGGWATLAIEVGYAVFVWPRWTRRAFALATIGLHIGIGLTMGLWSFSVLMMLFTTTAFLVPAEPAPVTQPRETEPIDAVSLSATCS